MYSSPLATDHFSRKQKAPKKRTCRVCKVKHIPHRPLQPTCGEYDCQLTYATRVIKKQEEKRAKEGRALVKKRRETLKTRSDYLREAQKAFNAFIRARDEGKPCICCDRTETQVTGLSAHGWDAGHYRSTGSAPHLRFDERNVHRQLVQCNRYGAGRAVDYRIGLIARIGLSEVEDLESDQSSPKWTIEDLKSIKARYIQKRKELQG